MAQVEIAPGKKIRMPKGWNPSDTDAFIRLTDFFADALAKASDEEIASLSVKWPGPLKAALRAKGITL